MYEFKIVHLLAVEHVAVLEFEVVIFEGAGSGNQIDIYQIIMIIITILPIPCVHSLETD